MNHALNEKLGEIKGAFLEGKGLDQRRVAQIKSMTKHNDHAGAQLAAAELVGLDHLAKKMKALNALKKMENGADTWLNKYQYQLHQELWQRAKPKLSDEDYNLLRSAF